MKLLSLLILCYVFVGTASAQDNLEKNALFHAEQMSNYFNNRDYRKYVDFLLPTLYGNDSTNKDKFASLWQTMLVSDTAKIKIIKVLKFLMNKDQYQAVFHSRFHDNDGYIFGVSNDKGSNWLFTTSYSREIQFEQIIQYIPSIDTSFSRIVDPRFGKRINYQIGKPVAHFNYMDINGNQLSSDLLKGKVIVMNFWSITCAPCITEIPELNKLVEKTKGKNVVYIAPAIYTSKKTLIDNFLPKHPFNYQIVLINNDDYSVTAIPTHIIIDQNLKVIDRFTGYSPNNIKQLENAIDGLLKK